MSVASGPVWTFAPTLLLDSGPVPLPRPIVQLRVQDGFDAARFKVPQRDGSLWAGRSRDGVDISIRGQFARHNGALALSEPEMLDAIETVRTALQPAAPEATYRLALFASDDSPVQYRGFVRCTTVKFEYDLSDHTLYGYTLMVHASDPRLHVGDLIVD